MFTFHHLVQFYETDLMKIVHHSNYLKYFEEARVAWATARGLIDYQKPSSAAHFAVLETHVQHLRPAFFGDSLEIYVQAKMEGIRVQFQYKIFCRIRNFELITTGQTKHVSLDEKLKPIKPSIQMRQILKEEPWIETWL